MVNLMRRIAIVVVFLLVCLTGGLWMMTGKAARIQAKEKYTVKIYEPNTVEVEKIKKVLTDEGYSNVTSAKIKRLVPKKTGFRVVSYFDKKELAEGYVKLLNEKKFPAVIKEVPNEEKVFIQVMGNFNDKKKALKTAVKSKDIIHIDFNVEENFKDISVQTIEIVVSDIGDADKAEALKNKLSDLVKDIEITTQEESSEDKKPDSGKDGEKSGNDKGKAAKEKDAKGK